MKSNLAYKCIACTFCVLICILYQYLKNPCQPCTFLIKSKQSVTLAIKGHDGPGLLTWEADFFNLVEGYFQSFLHIYIYQTLPFVGYLFIYFLVIQLI